MKLIYGFHMPLFFMISGYLWKGKKRVKDSFLSGLRRYILPYFILCTINMLRAPIFLFLHKPFPVTKYIVGILYSRGSTEWMPDCSPLWFLTAIFVTLMIFEIIQRCEHRLTRSLLIVFCGTASSLLSIYEIFKLPWNIDTALMGTVFVASGFAIAHNQFLQQFWSQSKQKCLLIVVVTFIIGLSSIYLNPIEQVSFNNNRYGNIALMLLGAIGICGTLVTVAYRFPWEKTHFHYLVWLGQHTIFVMGFDYFTGSIARFVLGKVGFENWLSVFFLKILMLTIGCFVWTWAISKIKAVRVRKVLMF